MNEKEFAKEMHSFIDDEYRQFNQIKKEILDVFGVFHNICVENNIRYYIAFGSLLGQVRDGGFLPWDSDFDVCIPIDDAQKLVDTLKTHLPDKYFFDSNYTNSKCPYFQTRIGNTKYDLEAVHLDIFYVFGIGDDASRAKVIQDQYTKLFNIRHMKYGYLENLRSKKKKSTFDRLKMINYFFKTVFYTANRLDMEYEKLVHAFSYETSSYVTVFCHDRYVYPKDIIEPVKLVNVNGVEMYYPQDEIQMLNSCYKNYKEYLPIKYRFEEFYRWVKERNGSETIPFYRV